MLRAIATFFILTGHFTQVVWKDSRDFGIGKAKTKDGKWLVVANYYPAGNLIGKNAENVPLPTDGDKSLIGSKDDELKGNKQLPIKLAYWQGDYTTEKLMYPNA